MKVVIYARFSSHSQTEQSIEGQLKVCYEYARAHDYTVIGEYIDRAQSAKTSDRIEFQKMIADSDNKTFEGVLVYQLDRFARNRIDSAIYKSRLKKNGIKVISAKENISEDASGILMEGVLESMAEYYSAESSTPSTWTEPEVGLSTPPRMCSRVDLPLPDGPTMETNSPRLTVRET